MHRRAECLLAIEPEADIKTSAEIHASSYVAAMATARLAPRSNDPVVMQNMALELLSTTAQKRSLHYLPNCVTLEKGLVYSSFQHQDQFQASFETHLRALNMAGVGFEFSGNITRIEAISDQSAICWIAWWQWPKDTRRYGPCWELMNVYVYRRIYTNDGRIFAGWEVVNRDQETEILNARVPSLYHRQLVQHPHPSQIAVASNREQQHLVQLQLAHQLLVDQNLYTQQQVLYAPPPQLLVSPNLYPQQPAPCPPPTQDIHYESVETALYTPPSTSAGANGGLDGTRKTKSRVGPGGPLFRRFRRTSRGELFQLPSTPCPSRIRNVDATIQKELSSSLKVPASPKENAEYKSELSISPERIWNFDVKDEYGIEDAPKEMDMHNFRIRSLSPNWLLDAWNEIELGQSLGVDLPEGQFEAGGIE